MHLFSYFPFNALPPSGRFASAQYRKCTRGCEIHWKQKGWNWQSCRICDNKRRGDGFYKWKLHASCHQPSRAPGENIGPGLRGSHTYLCRGIFQGGQSVPQKLDFRSSFHGLLKFRGSFLFRSRFLKSLFVLFSMKISNNCTFLRVLKVGASVDWFLSAQWYPIICTSNLNLMAMMMTLMSNYSLQTIYWGPTLSLE